MVSSGRSLHARSMLAPRVLSQCLYWTLTPAAGGCGRGKHSLRTVLRARPPEVFALQLAWESVHETADSIGDTMLCISQVGCCCLSSEPVLFSLLQCMEHRRH